tara:strand:- start:5592 stop:6431 length:840 start_codon:yes stop_codon:yes gene_type:complete
MIYSIFENWGIIWEEFLTKEESRLAEKLIRDNQFYSEINSFIEHIEDNYSKNQNKLISELLERDPVLAEKFNRGKVNLLKFVMKPTHQETEDGEFKKAVYLMDMELKHFIAFLIKNTNNCYMPKLLKLLYLFDLEHVKQTGYPATNLKYYAWKRGPVAKELRENIIKHSGEYSLPLFGSFNIETIELDNSSEAYRLKALFSLDEEYFTDRQEEILKSISLKYKDINSIELTEETKEIGNLWKDSSKEGLGKEIDLKLILKTIKDKEKRTSLIEYSKIFG